MIGLIPLLDWLLEPVRTMKWWKSAGGRKLRKSNIKTLSEVQISVHLFRQSLFHFPFKHLSFRWNGTMYLLISDSFSSPLTGLVPSSRSSSSTEEEIGHSIPQASKIPTSWVAGLLKSFQRYSKRLRLATPCSCRISHWLWCSRSIFRWSEMSCRRVMTSTRYCGLTTTTSFKSEWCVFGPISSSENKF